MYRSLILSLAFIAVVFSQSYQSSFTVTPLAKGVTYNGVFPITSTANAYHVNVHSIFVPQNATNVTITMFNTNSDCTYVNFFLRDEAPACSDDDFSASSTGNRYACANGYDIYNGVPTSGYTIDVNPSTYTDLFHYGVNKTWYLSAGRYSSSDYDEICTYNVTFTYSTPCTAGQVGIHDDFGSLDVDYCVGYTDIVANTVYPVTFSQVLGGGYPVFRTQIPQNTGSIQVSGWFNTSDLDFYGASFTTPTYSSNHCERTTYETSNSTVTPTMYYYVLDCPTPRAGPFYILIDGDNGEAYYGNMTLTEQVCSATTGGYLCQFAAAQLTSFATQTVTVNYNSSADYYSSYAWTYFYFDTPQGFKNGTISFTATTTSTSSGYITLRRDAYPEATSYYGYEDDSETQSVSTTGTTYNLALNSFDFYVPARFYIGLSCYTGTCTFALSSNVTVAPPAVTTGVAATTAALTTEGSTTSEPASNAIVVAFSALLMAFALLF